jgi:hypothetical protein
MEGTKMNDLVSASPPEDDGTGQAVPPNPGSENGDRAQERRRSTGPILSSDQCLAGLSQLAAMVVMGMVKPTVGNSARGMYAEILRSHERAGQNNQNQALADEDVRKILEANPWMLPIVEPCLTDDQLKRYMQEQGKNGAGDN